MHRFVLTCAGMHGIYKCLWATKIMQRRGFAWILVVLLLCSYWGVLGQGFACICPKKENRQKSSISYISSYIWGDILFKLHLKFLLHSWCSQIIKDFLRHCPHCLLHIRSSLLSKIFQLPFLEYFFNSFLFFMVNNSWLIDIDLTIFCIVSSSLVQNWFVKYAY